MKKISIAIVMMVFTTLTAMAQSGTNSPYSQYGFGVLADQTSGFNRGMNGLGIGFRESNQVNFINPASYSSIDSLTFIFDVGVSGQLTNFSENGVKRNAKNASFEYAVASFRLFKHVGLSFGIVPFTNVGYNYSTSGYVSNDKTNAYINTYKGDGGLRQVFLGFGVEPIKNVSFGVNGSYMWGDYNRSIGNSYTDGYVNNLAKYYRADIRTYRVDFGLQLTIPFDKNNSVTLGATYGLGHKINDDAECTILSTNTQTGVKDSTTFILEIYRDNNGSATYSLSEDYFKDRHKFTFGGEFCPGQYSRKFLNRIHYRFGVSYATPYLIINGQDGPKELSVSAGFGIPIMNSYNNRSILNISAQWVRTDSKSFITENTFRINIGLTFNERWFMKWKVE